VNVAVTNSGRQRPAEAARIVWTSAFDGISPADGELALIVTEHVFAMSQLCCKEFFGADRNRQKCSGLLRRVLQRKKTQFDSR
jgi:hypothetical protein